MAAPPPRTLVDRDELNARSRQLSTFAYVGELAVVNGQGRLPFPFDAQLLGWSAMVGATPVGADVGLRLNLNGAELDVGAIADGVSAMGERVLDQVVTVGDWISVDVTAVGSTTPGSDLTVALHWRSV